MGEARRAETVATACPHDCPSTCALEVERLDARTIGRIRGAGTNSYTAGVICAKVARYAERVHNPDRLAHPMQRIGDKGEGRFRRLSWEQALDEVAGRLRSIAERHGAEAIWPYFYGGTLGLVQRFAIERLRHAMRYSRQKQTICVGIVNAGWMAGAGRLSGTDPREMAESDLIVLWGSNAVATQVNVMTHVTRARKGRGAKLVVVDPYRTSSAEAADLHLRPRPGTDGALACAVMHVLFRDGFADRDYLRRYTDVPETLEAHLRPRGPEWAADITGLSAASIEDFARLYGGTRRSFIRVGYGFSRSRNGAVNVHAVACLPAVTGAWTERGGGALYHNGGIYPWDRVFLEGKDLVDPGMRELDMSRIGAVLEGEAADLAGGPPVMALLVQNSNPAVVAPESARVARGLARKDLFTCVHEQVMTDTARFADILLPATMFLEHDDLYQAAGHSHVQIGPRVIEPHAECRSSHWVIGELARRLGVTDARFGLDEWQTIEALLRGAGLPDAATLRGSRGHDMQPPFAEAHFLNGFGHPDGRFRFAPDWAALGPLGSVMPRLPDHWPVTEAADASMPFRLVTAPARSFLVSSFSETPSSRAREGEPTALIHPADAAAHGIRSGDYVRLGNALGAVVVRARATDAVDRGVIVVETLWPNSDYRGGMGINALVGADPVAPNGGAAFHDSAVWLRREAAAPASA